MGSLYRFDIYLPLKDRDGIRVPITKMQAIRKEIVEKFHGITHTSMIGSPAYTGLWQPSKKRRLVQDLNSVFTIFADRTEDSYNFFIERKERWRKELNHKELVITMSEIEALPD